MRRWPVSPRRHTHRLGRLGNRVNAYARQRCSDRLGQNVVFPSFEEACFAPESFDVVTFWHVLEHLPIPASAFAEARRLLKPGGVLALAVPNFGSRESFVWRQHWIYLMAPTHFYHFSRPTLSRYLTAHGFNVVATRQNGGPPSLSANLLRTLRVALLDPIARARHRSTNPTARPVEPPRARTDDADQSRAPLEIGQVDDVTKRRLHQVMGRLVSPVAGLIDHAGCGPELKVYARKAEG